jgi:CRISPR-associated protein Csb1
VAPNPLDYDRLRAGETRIIGGQPVPCVLLDSVQSQANRLELALLEWHRSAEKGKNPFPLVQIDVEGTDAKEVGLFTALEAPHTIAEAMFRGGRWTGGDHGRTDRVSQSIRELDR